MKHCYFLSLIIILSISCKDKNIEKTKTHSIKVIESKGYLVPKDSIQEPKIVLAGKPSIIQAGIPEIVIANTNIQLAKTPQFIAVGTPKICTPGQDTFLLPKSVLAINKPIVASIPEVVIAKDAYFKDQNPQNFSSFNKLQGLKHGNINCLFEDKAGNIWLGSNGGGVSKYDGKSFTHFTDKQGLSNNIVWCILEDKLGNIWFGTVGGASKYDGKAFTNFTEKEGLSNDVVISMLEDRDGNIWFGTDGGGVSKYNGNLRSINQNENLTKSPNQQGAQFTHYTEKEGLCNNVVETIVEDKFGNIWFGAIGGGVSKFDGKSFSRFTSNEGFSNTVVWDIVEDKLGNLWFATGGGGVLKYDGRSFTNYTTNEGLSNNFVTRILEDKSGNLWFCTNGGGVSKFDGNRVETIEKGEIVPINDQLDLIKKNGKLVKTFKHFTEKEGLNNNIVWDVLEDKSGNIWFSTSGGGISKYDGKCFTHISDKEGLNNNLIWSILEDKAGNIWLGSNGGGVSKYDGNSFAHYTNKEGLGSNEEGLGNNVVWCILEDKLGNLWFGKNYGGVSKFDGKSFTHYSIKEGLSGNVVRCMKEDRYGNIWFGTNGNGVTKFDGKSFTHFNFKEGLTSDMILCIEEDKLGNLWFGSLGAGLTKYDGNRIDAILRGENIPLKEQKDLVKINGKFIKSFTHFTEKEGLPNDDIKCLLCDNSGNLWIGTNGGGVSKYKDNTFVNFTEKEGLSNNVVTSMLEAKNGDLWFGTRFGLSQLTSSKLADFNTKLNAKTIKEEDVFFKNYTYEDGFLGIGCNGNSICETREGEIWIGANDRLTIYHPPTSKEMREKATSPNIQLTRVDLYNENIPWVNLDKNKDTLLLLGNGVGISNFQLNGVTNWYSLPNQLSLAYNNNYLTFNYIGITMKQPKKVKYKYKLEGIDENWSALTNRTEATYGNLPSGDFTFKVKAMDSAGNWSKEFSYLFTIRPPWWQTWWFRLLIVLIVVGSVWYYINRREMKLIAAKQKLEKTVDERTAEVVEQKYLIEEKHKEITDSINYAERIQRALLASKVLLDENLTSTGNSKRNYFILFKPKDIVSGDFYWAAKTKEENFIIVTADSTGHGVPGAIMSMLNISCLDKAITKDIESPDLILNETRNLIIEHLKNDGSPDGGKDGMDGSLLSFDFKNNILYSASAFNPIWIIRNKRIIEIKGDRMPIGKHDNDNIPFTLHTTDLEIGDVVYTLTDGFPDQFGGEFGKKFKYKKLQELLLTIHQDSMRDQKQKLNIVFDEWKGKLEQVDDVCLIGIRI